MMDRSVSVGRVMLCGHGLHVQMREAMNGDRSLRQRPSRGRTDHYGAHGRRLSGLGWGRGVA